LFFCVLHVSRLFAGKLALAALELPVRRPVHLTHRVADIGRMSHLQALAHPNRVCASLAQRLQKPPALLIVGQDGTALMAAGHQMASRSWKFDAQGPGHIPNYPTPTPQPLSNCKNKN
jgi:hypothetical protein